MIVGVRGVVRRKNTINGIFEKFPKLKETMAEARNVISGVTGGPVELKADPS